MRISALGAPGSITSPPRNAEDDEQRDDGERHQDHSPHPRHTHQARDTGPRGAIVWNLDGLWELRCSRATPTPIANTATRTIAKTSHCLIAYAHPAGGDPQTRSLW